MSTEGMAGPQTALASDEEVICTLFEGDYEFGVAVLLNSIVQRGFRGLFWVGFRGALPAWTAGLSKTADGQFQVGEARLAFEVLESSHHFSQYKPEFMISLFERGIARDRLWYFDPDITVRCDWSFYQKWIRHGVCLCQEITMGTMPSDHPIRLEWINLARQVGMGDPVRKQERYYNSGFVGLEKAKIGFLQMWKSASRLADLAGVNQGHFLHQNRAETFYTVDQDTMNISTMYSETPFSTVGPEGMGWMTGGFTMYHTLGSMKPWRKRFFLEALKGDPPVGGDRHFISCADGPIQPYSAARLRGLRFSLKLAGLIGRFYRRG